MEKRENRDGNKNEKNFKTEGHESQNVKYLPSEMRLTFRQIIKNWTGIKGPKIFQNEKKK